jgi:hypothetical protein
MLVPAIFEPTKPALLFPFCGEQYFYLFCVKSSETSLNYTQTPKRVGKTAVDVAQEAKSHVARIVGVSL